MHNRRAPQQAQWNEAPTERRAQWCAWGAGALDEAQSTTPSQYVLLQGKTTPRNLPASHCRRYGAHDSRVCAYSTLLALPAPDAEGNGTPLVLFLGEGELCQECNLSPLCC